MIFVYHDYLSGCKLQTINPAEYSDHWKWLKILINKNPNIVYAMYKTHHQKKESIIIEDNLFVENYNLNIQQYHQLGLPQNLLEDIFFLIYIYNL